MRKLKQKLRRWRLKRNGVQAKPQLEAKCQLIGDDDSGWWVYPDELDSESIIYSFGVGKNISFDQEITQLTGATVHMFDPTPRTLEWIKHQPLSPTLNFHPYGIADFDGELTFFPPKRQSSMHFTPVQRYTDKKTQALQNQQVQAPVKRLTTIMEELGHQAIDVLKIDIEGGEYQVLQDIRVEKIPIKQIAIEFHHCYRTIPVQKTIDEIKALQIDGFELAFISDRTYEYTFILKSKNND